MSDLQIPWMDMEKFGEVMRETSVVRTNLTIEELQGIKDKLIAMDDRFKNVELSRVKDFFDLYNSIFTAVENYHIKYWFGDKPIIKEVAKPKVEPIIPSNNKERHKLNKLKPFATMDDKVKWHIDHVANCKCWPMPMYVKKEIEKRMK